MICPKCGSANINVVNEQESAKTRGKSMGCLWTLGRWFLIFITCGLWLLVGKRRATGKTEFTYSTMGICQNCGNKFPIPNQ